MIRDRLQAAHGNGWAIGTASATPALQNEKRKGMDWESNGQTPTKDSANGDNSTVEKLGGLLGSLGSKLTQHSSHAQHDHKDGSEIMIGMFMHTPWPSSEIFRCLPSKCITWLAGHC